MRHVFIFRCLIYLLSVTSAQTAFAVDSAYTTEQDVLKSPSHPVLVPTPPSPRALPAQPQSPEPPAGPVDRFKSTIIGLQNAIMGRRKPLHVTSHVTTADKVYYLRDLKYRTAKHSSPDALVFIAKGFDPTKPVSLLIHNHGLTTNVVQEFNDAKLQQQLESSPQNSVFIMPEWAFDPSAYSSKAGPFHTPGFFKNMLVEIMSKTEPLKELTLDDVNAIYVSSFSGGFRAAVTEISKNGLDNKVRGVTLLDSLYVGDHFDPWLKANIKDLHDGKKFFHNFFFDTAGHSRAQAKRVENLLESAGLSKSCLLKDFDNPDNLLEPEVIARHSIIYKFSKVGAPGRNLHQAVNSHYVGLSMKALKLRRDNVSIAATMP